MDRSDIAKLVDTEMKKFDRAKANFQKVFDLNPRSAIEWHSGRVARAQTIYTELLPLEAAIKREDVTDDELKSWIIEAAGILADRLLSPSNSQSTSPWDNASTLEENVGRGEVRKFLIRLANEL